MAKKPIIAGGLILFSLGLAQAGVLKLVQTVPLRDVKGRIDHMALDAGGHRLYVAAIGNDTVEVVDLKLGRQVHSITGFDEPQDVIWSAKSDRIIVSNGGDGTCQAIDPDSFKRLQTTKLGEDDADNMRYDPSANRVFVGYGDGALAIMDGQSNKVLASVKLPGHPEAFQYEKNGPRIFVNIPGAREIAVIDRDKGAVMRKWESLGARSNFPMALDEAHHRLFVGFRNPPRLAVFDTESGKQVASLDSSGDSDDIFYDKARRRIYMSCGEGFIDVFRQDDPDRYALLEQFPTASGARTSYFSPETGNLYVAVPRGVFQNAEIRIYNIQP